MRTHAVVFGAEGVEADLLRPQRRLRWLRRFRLERTMQSLVSSVLLRMPGKDEARSNAQRAQPQADPREAPWRVRGAERRAVITQDGGGHSEVVKALVQDGTDVAGARGAVRRTREEKARGGIDDGQGIAPVSVARPELALVVNCPEGVWLLRDPRGREAWSVQAAWVAVAGRESVPRYAAAS